MRWDNKWSKSWRAREAYLHVDLVLLVRVHCVVGRAGSRVESLVGHVTEAASGGKAVGSDGDDVGLQRQRRLRSVRECLWLEKGRYVVAAVSAEVFLGPQVPLGFWRGREQGEVR